MVQNQCIDARSACPGSFYVFKRQLTRDVVLHVSALCLSQPFYVISVRMMAQFVGQETIYK